MKSEIVGVELRWFFDDAPPREVTQWFKNGLPGPAVDKQRREDLYLGVSGRSDFGLKLRGGKLELKWRTRSWRLVIGQGLGRGVAEIWDKESWKYARTLRGKVDKAFSKAELPGLRWRVAKSRRRRKYQIHASGKLIPVAMAHKKREGIVLVEHTSLSLDDGRAWTLAFDVVVDAAQVRDVVLQVVEQVLAGYPGPRLTALQSFGYPKWLLSRETDG